LDPDLGISWVFALPAILGFYLLIKGLLFDHGERKERRLLIFCGAVSMIGLLVLYCSFYWGKFTQPAMNRMALVFLPFMAFGAAFLFNELGRRYRFIRSGHLLAFSIIILCILFPVGAKQKYIRQLSRAIEYDAIMSYLRPWHCQDGKTLIISDRPQLYLIHNYPCMDFASFNGQPDLLKKDPNKWSTILTLQRYRCADGLVSAGNQLSETKVQPLAAIGLPNSWCIGVQRLIAGGAQETPFIGP
jgi:hypothetical protein